MSRMQHKRRVGVIYHAADCTDVYILLEMHCVSPLISNILLQIFTVYKLRHNH